MLTHHGEGMCQQTEVHFQIRVCPVSSRPSSWRNEQAQAGVTNHFVCVCAKGLDQTQWSRHGLLLLLLFFSRPVVSNSLRPLGLQHAKPPVILCHPLLLPPSIFPASGSFVTLNILFGKKKSLGICKTSQFAPYFTIQKIYFHHLRGKTTIDLKSVTFYHHCVFAKARNHLYCPIRTVLYTDFGLQ